MPDQPANDAIGKSRGRNLQLAPGFEAIVRAAAERAAHERTAHSPAALVVPKSPIYFAKQIKVVTDETPAHEMVDFALQRSLSHIGVGAVVTYNRPGVLIDDKNTAHDPRSIRPLAYSLTLAEPGEGGALYRFVIDARSPVALPALQEMLHLQVPMVGHFIRTVLYCLWQQGLPAPRHLWDTWVHENAVHLGLHHPNYQAGQADQAAHVRAREHAEEDKEFLLTVTAACQRHGVDSPPFDAMDRVQRSFLNHTDAAPLNNEQTQYAAAGADAAARLYLPQLLEAAQAGLLQHLVTIEMPWVVTSARMGWTGVRVDQDRCSAIKAAAERHLATLEPQLKAFGINNVNSFEELSRFFERNGLLDLFRRGGEISFDKDQLALLEDRHPAIPLIRSARKIHDIRREKILTGELVGADGRVHPDYRQLGAATGRESCRWPNVMGLGKVFRPLIVPEPGRGIGEVDWCQIEVGIAAAVYRDEKLIQLYNTDDVYSAMAKLFYVGELAAEDLDLPGASFKAKFANLRARMKICTLGIIYGYTPLGLAAQLRSTEAEAASLQTRFMAMFPVLAKALKNVSAYGSLRGHVSTVTGLRRHRARQGRPTRWEQNWMTNHPVQGTAAAIFKAVGNRLDRQYQEYDARLIIPMHDAYVFESPLDVLEAVAVLTAREMIDTVKEFFPELRPRVEINIYQPNCWNKDGYADSLDRWIECPTFSL